MNQSTLIVAKMRPGAAPEVARIFAESDAGELPEMIGVARRTLFTFHDLYFHLVEADDTIAPRLDTVRDHPLFLDINAKLAPYMTPYDPGWREPRDSMARPFYSWPSDRPLRTQG